MDKKDLSVCIVGKDSATFLKQCIESCLKLTDQISYFDLESKDNSTEVAKTCGIYVVNSPPDQKISEILRKFHKSNWILFMKPGEKILYESKSKIMKILDNNQTMGYNFVIKTPVPSETLENFRWIKIPGKPDRYSPESLIVPRIEIRLVRRKFFVKALNHMVSSSPDDVFSFSSQIFKDIQIHSLQHAEKIQEEINQNHTRDLEMKYLRGEVSVNADDDYGMWELGDDWIIYSVLTKDDLSRYYRGLAMGFGSERMYLTMLHNLGKFGRFSEARDFFEVWQEKWGVFDTPEPYRIGGIIYANLFQMEKAAFLFKKYLNMIPEELAGESLALLAKALLLQGMKDEAIEHLRHSLRLRTDPFDNFLLQTIEQINWKPPKLSLCMIARDEHKHISKALYSLVDIVDEIILVDTGSQDETKDIARKFNAKIIDMDWEEDFSKARNLGLQQASGDYILCLDADEYIDPRERIKLALFKMILPHERDVAFRIMIAIEKEDEEMSVMLRLPITVQPDCQVRLFPAQKGICFDGTAFESVDKSVIAQGFKIEKCDIFTITHSGTDRNWRENRKESAVKKLHHQTNSNPEIALKTALFYLKLGNMDAVSECLKSTCIDNPRLLMKIIALFSRLGRPKHVAGLINRMLREYPDSIELILAKAELHFADGEYIDVYETLNPNMGRIEKIMSREDRANASYLYGMALLETDNLESGIEFISDARELDSWNLRYKLGGIFALTLAKQWEQSILALLEIIKEEKLSHPETIRDFADLGMLFAKLIHHFEASNRIEAAHLCRKVFLTIVNDKIYEPEITQKMVILLDNYQSNLKGAYSE